MPTGHVYNIRAPDGTSIYIGSTTKTEATRWRCWKTAAKVDYLSCPLLRHAKEHWGNLDSCSYHVLTTVDLPDNDATAKQILRRLEAAFIESALARKEPLLNILNRVSRCAQAGTIPKVIPPTKRGGNWKQTSA